MWALPSAHACSLITACVFTLCAQANNDTSKAVSGSKVNVFFQLYIVLMRQFQTQVCGIYSFACLAWLRCEVLMFRTNVHAPCCCSQWRDTKYNLARFVIITLIYLFFGVLFRGIKRTDFSSVQVCSGLFRCEQ